MKGFIIPDTFSLRGPEVVAFAVGDSWFTSTPGKGGSAPVTERLFVAVLRKHKVFPKRNGKEHILRLYFYPGVTGHECYDFTQAFVATTAALPDLTDEWSMFPVNGKKVKKDAMFHLCMGGARFKKWTVTVKALKELVRAMSVHLEEPE